MVLTCNSPQKEIDAIVKQYPQITDIVTSGNGDIPPAQPAVVPGTKTLVLETGHKGMYALALGIYDDPKEPLRYQRIPLDARFGDNEAIANIFALYQDQLASLGLQKLGVRAAPHPTGRGLFAGSAACGQCHTQAYKVWIETPHAKAMKTLEDGTPPGSSIPSALAAMPRAGNRRSITRTLAATKT